MIIEDILDIHNKFEFFRELFVTGLVDTSNVFFIQMYKKVIEFERFYCKNDLNVDDVDKMLKINVEFDVIRFKLYKYLTERRTN